MEETVVQSTTIFPAFQFFWFNSRVLKREFNIKSSKLSLRCRRNRQTMGRNKNTPGKKNCVRNSQKEEKQKKQNGKRKRESFARWNDPVQFSRQKLHDTFEFNTCKASRRSSGWAGCTLRLPVICAHFRSRWRASREKRHMQQFRSAGLSVILSV